MIGGLLLLPLLASAEAPKQPAEFVLGDLEKVLLPGNYRCLPWSDQWVDSESDRVFLLEPNGWAVSLHTVFTEEPAQGLMFELDKQVSEDITLRLGGGIVVLGRESTIGDIYFDESMQMSQLGLYVDWKVLPANISLVAGLVLHDTQVDITAWPKPDLIYSLNGRLYTSAQLGKLHGELSYESLSPYAGIAWRKQLGWGSHWHFSADVGTLFGMQPSLSLRSDAAITGINDDLAVEARQLEKEFADQFLIATIGLSYAF